ncbi:transcription factor SPT20 homolog isoform X2 [Betta splendens]|uniref:Transcription factor SPT20 homolog isoform X2 n=1 Tax=Betta splendens TaxID=158456 RepID=A0A8M1H6W6_BETSP|nr:transcription factor SPT20 homolog isoform X2 [Betta splendens]
MIRAPASQAARGARLSESATLHRLALQRRQSQQFQLQYRHQAAQQAFNAFPTGEALRFVDAEIHQPPWTDHSLDVSDDALLEVSPDPGEIFTAGECVVNAPPSTPEPPQQPQEQQQQQQQQEPRSPEEECLIGELEHVLSRQPSVEPSTS